MRNQGLKRLLFIRNPFTLAGTCFSVTRAAGAEGGTGQEGASKALQQGQALGTPSFMARFS